MKQRIRRIFISTGEVSGDLQGSLLVQALQRQAAQRYLELEILALGGERMAAAGAKLLADTSAIGSIGIVESLPYVLSTLRIQRRVKQQLRQHPPDLVVMIDYFGPNLGIGSFVRQALPQVPTVYYIAPQEWVWSINRHNTERILQITDRLLAIFPAEADYYRNQGGSVTWVGHPLIDRVQSAPTRAQARQQLGLDADQLVIALIPASRRQELKYVLPILCEAAQHIQAQLPQVQFWIPLSLEQYRPAMEAAIQRYGLQARILSGQSQTVIAAADLALAKSGTVNLEIALLNVPQVVMYRIHPVTAWIAEHLLKFSAPFVSPPNLVLMEPLIPEFLQTQATPERIAAAALDILCHDQRRQEIQAGYQRLRQQLGAVGVCDRAAGEILELLDTALRNRGIT
ncbi:MAG: lipid-A-disaccharide synthase [Synechococcales cyanobacterium M58_A2018_015]|nr:lipid-A-disaccharide synthase [Synechococcales cyanobacterium M58_A2018_015]